MELTLRNSLIARTGLKNASDFQVAIFAHIEAQLVAMAARKAIFNLIVEAVAGSGKTTTIVAAANLIPAWMKACFLAFGKPIADELALRLPKHVWAKTINSMGNTIWNNYQDGVTGRRGSVEVKKFKVANLMRNIMSPAEIAEHGDAVRFLVGMSKSVGITPSELTSVVPVNGLRDTDETFKSILRHYGENVPLWAQSQVFAWVRAVLVADLRMEMTIDFDDQKYFPTVKRASGRPIPVRYKFDVIILDEAQDLNAVDMALIRLISKPSTLFIFVGDPNQAIYGFRGADTEAMAKVAAEFSTTSLPLSTTYRCPLSHVRHAQELVPAIQAAPGAKEGTIEHLTTYKADLFQAGQLVICRNNAPLIELAWALIANRIPCMVKGRDIGQGIISLLKKLNATDVVDLSQKLSVWMATQLAAADQDDAEAAQKIRDKFDTLMVFVRENTDNEVASVIADIESLFSDNVAGNKVVLCSIHKAKGLEAETVIVLDNDLMYPRWVNHGTWQWKQEENLDYVKRTRAKDRLVFITLAGFVR